MSDDEYYDQEYDDPDAWRRKPTGQIRVVEDAGQTLIPLDEAVRLLEGWLKMTPGQREWYSNGYGPLKVTRLK